MRCKNCGWEYRQDSIVCEKCGFPMTEHILETTTIIPGLQTSSESGKMKVRCPNGHIYDASIYGDTCPLCPAPSLVQSTVVDEEMCYTRPFQEKHTFPESPILGFLYSISRRGITEYWPLHIGRNTIGRSNSNDIILSEKSVSSSHAVIYISRNSELKVYIRDDYSSNGTILNNEILGFDRYECMNGDIIQIGNYQLYLIIIDSDEIGLKVSEKFADGEEISNHIVGRECSDEQRASRNHRPTSIRRIGNPSYKGSVENQSSEDGLRKKKEMGQELLRCGSVKNTPDGTTIKDVNEDRMSYPDCKLAESSEPFTFGPLIENRDRAKPLIGVFLDRLFGRKANEVYSSIFAPAEVKRKSHMLVQVYLHLNEETEKVKSFAQESDQHAERRDYIPLQCKLKKGDKVDVLLNIYGETLLMSKMSYVIWRGHFVKCSFDCSNVLRDIDVDELSCVALLSVNGMPVGEMRFITKIVDAPRQLNPEIIAHKYSKVFISYSHQDESKVKFLHEGLELGAVPHFFDRKYLKAGDVFPKVIQDYINSADLFILCWSENASKSEYVQKERLQALERAFPQVRPEHAAKLRIYPMCIEPHAELPGDMKNYYHFGEI